MSTPDPYFVHRHALRSVLMDSLPEDWSPPDNSDCREYAWFLWRQQLSGLLLKLLEPIKEKPEIVPLFEAVTLSVKSQAGLGLPQDHVLNLAHKKLSEANIPYFVAKGAHLRNVYYNSPLLRASADIDLFVKENAKAMALQAFAEAGFEANPLAETLSHEIKLSKHNTAIDLHWHLMRPGRYRDGLMAWLFSRRERFGEYWGLDATASLLVMLAHPAITKYLISPTSMLIHQVDQARLIAAGKVDWDEMESALTRYGLRTAAWSSLYLLRELGGVEAPDGFEARIRPNRLQAVYLRQWIDRAWITRWFETRWLVAGGFSLALQDSLADVLRAVRAKTQALNPPLP